MTKIVSRVYPSAPKLPARKRVAAYARVSSDKDAMLHSLSAQVSYYSTMIQKRPSWEYAGVYADEGITGTKDIRAEFQRMLADCRASKVDMVITKSISRFARNTVTLLNTVRELKALGIDVFFEKENIHSLSGDGELMLTILASFAQEESLSVSENCKWRTRNRFKEGELANLRFMYGYRINKGKIEIDPEQAATVQWIFEQYVNGVGCRQIAQQLTDSGAPSCRGGKWVRNNIILLLKNEKYAGNALLQKRYVADHLTKALVPNHGVLPKYYAENTHPPIVDMETFLNAQALLEENRLKSNIALKAPASYPLTGIIVCGQCGKHYTRRAKGESASWNCTTYLQFGKTACPAKQIPEEVLLRLMAEAMGLPKFDAGTLRERIQEIRVPCSNRLIFILTDGRTVEKEWQYKSRRDSWSEDARRRVSEREIQRRRGICQ